MLLDHSFPSKPHFRELEQLSPDEGVYGTMAISGSICARTSIFLPKCAEYLTSWDSCTLQTYNYDFL